MALQNSITTAPQTKRIRVDDKFLLEFEAFFN
jgi:hypothetical protein